jgi:Leucine-rich repeat (LRR) protein
VVSDLTPLQGLTRLRWLILGENSISDVSPLQGLMELFRLDLDDNAISDVQALVDNPGLGSRDEVDLSNNPLSQQALCEHIPMLLARGVTVFFDGSCAP